MPFSWLRSPQLLQAFQTASAWPEQPKSLKAAHETTGVTQAPDFLTMRNSPILSVKKSINVIAARDW